MSEIKGMPTVKDGWDSFLRAVFPEGCSPLQEKVMKESFYAGAQQMAHISITVASLLPDTEEGADQGVEHLESCRQELRDFFNADRHPRDHMKGGIDG